MSASIGLSKLLFREHIESLVEEILQLLHTTIQLGIAEVTDQPSCEEPNLSTMSLFDLVERSIGSHPEEREIVSLFAERQSMLQLRPLHRPGVALRRLTSNDMHAAKEHRAIERSERLSPVQLRFEDQLTERTQAITTSDQSMLFIQQAIEGNLIYRQRGAKTPLVASQQLLQL